MPHDYYKRVVKEQIGAELGPLNSYGTGIIFTPKSDEAFAAAKDIFELQAKQVGLKIIGWRKVESGN